QDGHQFIVYPRLEILPGKLAVRGFGQNRSQHVTQFVLLTGKVFEVLVQPHRVIAGCRQLVPFQVEKFIGRHVIRQDVLAVRMQYTGECDTLEYNIILDDKMYETSIIVRIWLLLTVFFSIVSSIEVPLFGCGNVTNGGIEPYIQFFSLCLLKGHVDAPVEIPRHRPRLQARLKPRAALSVNIGLQHIFFTFQQPLFQPRLILIQRKIPMLRFTKHGRLSTKRGNRVNEVYWIKRGSTLLTLVAIRPIAIAVGTSTCNVTVGQKLVELLVVILLRRLLDKFAFLVQIKEKFLRQLMMDFFRSTMVNIKGDSKLFEARLNLGVVLINNRLRRGILLLCLDGNRCTVFIRSTHIHHLLFVDPHEG